MRNHCQDIQNREREREIERVRERLGDGAYSRRKVTLIGQATIVRELNNNRGPRGEGNIIMVKIDLELIDRRRLLGGDLRSRQSTVTVQ